MTAAERIRAKLLDLAIRGKLVPQDANDEPAEALLAKIRDEKEKLVKMKKIKKSKLTSPMSDEEKAFALPKGWTWCWLGDITAKIGSGSTPKGGKSVYVEQGIKFIREQNVHNDGLCEEGMVFIDEHTNSKMAGTVVRPCDLLMNITGASIGRTALVPDDFDIGNVNQHVLIVRLIAPTDQHYIHLVLCSPFIIKIMLRSQTGDKPGLSAEKVSGFPIPLPPLAEQKRIVARLEELLKAVDTLGECAGKFDTLSDKARAKILDLAIRGKLGVQDPNDESAEALLAKICDEKEKLVKAKKIKKEKPHPPVDDDEKPFDLPKGWAWCRFCDVLNYLRPDNYIVKSDEYNDRYDTPVLTAGLSFILGYTNEKDGHFAATKENPVIIFDDFTTSTQWVDFEFKVKSSAMKILEPFNRDLVDMRYLFFAIKNTRYTPSTHSRQWIDKFSKILLALPPLAEQKRIVAKVEAMLAACDKLKGMCA